LGENFSTKYPHILVEWGEGHEWTNDPPPKEARLRVDFTNKVQLTNKMVETGKEFLSTKSPRKGVEEMSTNDLSRIIIIIIIITGNEKKVGQ
jgi:hypothetical protein